MDDQPFPLPRATRETEILVGDGGAVYGPFDFKIFDPQDVRAYVRHAGEDWKLADIAVEKVEGFEFDDFTVTFAEALPATSSYIVQSSRLHGRQTAVTRGGAISARELEKELSKQGSVIEELRRDVNRNGSVVPVEPGRVLIAGDDGRVRPGPSADQIASAQAAAEAAEAAQAAAEAAAAGINLPSIGLSDAGKMLRVKDDLTGYDLIKVHDVVPISRFCVGDGSDEYDEIEAFFAAIPDGGEGYVDIPVWTSGGHVLDRRNIKLSARAAYFQDDTSVAEYAVAGGFFNLIDDSGLDPGEAVLWIRNNSGSGSQWGRRTWTTLEGIGVHGNRDNGNDGVIGIRITGRNVRVKECIVLECYDGIVGEDDPDAVGGCNSCQFFDNWVGYCDRYGIRLDRTSRSGDNQLTGGHYYWCDEAGVYAEGSTTSILGVFSWWNYVGFVIDDANFDNITLDACAAYDNAAEGALVNGKTKHVRFLGGSFHANGNYPRWASLPGSPTISDTRRTGIRFAGAATGGLVLGVGVGFLNTVGSQPSATAQYYGVRVDNPSASVSCDYIIADHAGDTSQVLITHSSAPNYWHGRNAPANSGRHPGFTATGAIDMNNKNISQVAVLGFSAAEIITSIVSGTITVTKAQAVLNVSGGGDITDIDCSALPEGAVFFLRNANNTAPVLKHDVNKIRLAGTDVTLAQNQRGVLLVRIGSTNTVWQAG